jgi:hypothetical protein
MKRVLSAILIIGFFLTTTILNGLSYGQEEADAVIGEVIEIVYEENIIQVGNRNYIVEKVFLDYGTSEDLLLGRFANLEVGSLVQVLPGEKWEGFWKAEKVVLFLGEKREEVLERIR